MYDREGFILNDTRSYCFDSEKKKFREVSCVNYFNHNALGSLFVLIYIFFEFNIREIFISIVKKVILKKTF